MKNVKNLYILRGLPGSGKNMLADYLSDSMDESIVLSNDDYFYNEDGEYVFESSKWLDAFNGCKEKCELAMGKGISNIFIANINNKEKYMIPFRELAVQYGYTVFHMIVENRHGGVNKHGCDERILVSMEINMKNNIKLR